MSDFTDEAPPEKGTPLLLGVIGSRQDCSQTKLLEDVLTPILQELGRIPERVILPSEGITSIYISDWADTLKIPTQIYEADWHRHQRRAKIYRDARIQQEASHFLIFLNKRSEYNEKLAIRLANKGYSVFTVTYSDWSLELLTRTERPSLSSPPARPATRGSKRGTGKEPEQPRWTQSEGPGTQVQLTSLWGACKQTE
jgi:hypothetical protein